MAARVNTAEGIAVNQVNGHVYITDQGNRRVEEFDADGNFVRSWAGMWSKAVPPGQGR